MCLKGYPIFVHRRWNNHHDHHTCPSVVRHAWLGLGCAVYIFNGKKYILNKMKAKPKKFIQPRNQKHQRKKQQKETPKNWGHPRGIKDAKHPRRKHPEFKDKETIKLLFFFFFRNFTVRSISLFCVCQHASNKRQCMSDTHACTPSKEACVPNSRKFRFCFNCDFDWVCN